MKLPLGLPVVLYVLQLLVCTAHLATVLTSGPTSGTYGTSGLSSIMRDCSDLPQGTTGGVYTIMVDLQNPTPAYCDMDDGEGWTVFQRRADILPRQDFYLDWQAYKWGLGSFAGEFWWGLHPLWQLTSQSDRTYELRVDLEDWDEQTAYATYQDFTIASEADNYRIAFTDYAGDAGDSLRKVYPYYFTFTTFTKGRWVGEKILDVFAREFRAHPAEEYHSNLMGVTVS
ncbi:Angiopoietin-4 [Amphibalanus amphitrite]|uniref:Angiopoietin-4 n=1 Tax=Amphibalanus amphitrite TaxID=1232801 RepID=A0A6A4VGY9_AMPAM|nr:Angiopoietin-4 [Amphibalanus amphitrite]